METIKEMIARMCPEGVTRVRLGDYCKVLRGKRVTKDKLDQKGLYNVYHGGLEPLGRYNQFNRPAKTVMIINVGASAGTIGFCEEPFWSSDGCFCLSKNDNATDKYLFHSLLIIENQIQSKVRKAGIPTLDSNVIENLEIPLPPLPIQQEIVRILDTFTTLQSNLETELAARQKQYEHYRNELLTFDKNDKSVEWKPIGEIGKLVRGNGLQKTDFTEDGIGCIHYGQIYTRLGFSCEKTLTFVSPDLAKSLTKVEPGDIVMACTSENVEDVCKSVVWLGNETIVTGGHACVFKHKENPKYIGYCLLTNDFFNQKRAYAYGAKVIDIKTEKLALIQLPIPSLQRQQEIVNILDTFEATISNLKQEIEARKKQYEYYREQLLTFN